MIPTISQYNPNNEFFTEELCFITEILNSPNDAEQSIAYARVQPGVTTRWHALIDTTERYVILAGQGLVEIGDLPATEMKAFDVAIIPAGTRQRITNTGLPISYSWPYVRQDLHHCATKTSKPTPATPVNKTNNKACRAILAAVLCALDKS